MDRQKLIDEIKVEYARLAEMENQDSFTGPPGSIPPEAYYEKLLDEVLAGILAGRFDGFATGREIVEVVAKGHARWGISM